ncbi:MAG: CCA tRNA nucleotidyltransferase [Methanotrichaceae archaeon]|nr:CCA tRNA nucleotidyltransferase [Methanotrichaceae archaeon]
MKSILSELRNEVLRRIKPKPEERERLRTVADSLLSRIENLAQSEKIRCAPVLVGSAARGTWLSGDHDLDIFLAIPPNEDLNRALELARKVAPIYEEKYAEHAYVHAIIDGFDIDLVPCFHLESASCMKSAVDRTPFHNKYVTSRIKGLEDEVLLIKQFMKGAGVYGSELRIGGFSGYLAELLILHYDSFLAALEAASSWKPGEIIDLEGHSSRSHQEPLVVIDPIDPSRNVAAALTLDKMMQFTAASRCFLRQPALNFFFPPEQRPLSDQELLEYIEERSSLFILIEFSSPNVVDDVLFPQLRKAEQSIRALIERQEFSVLRSDVGCYGIKAFILLELDVWALPNVRRSIGPPVWVEMHLDRFISSHPSPLSGPYIENGHAIVEIPRKFTRVQDLLLKEMARLSLGKHISEEICQGYNIYIGAELARIKDIDFRIFLADYMMAKTRII